MCTQTDSICSNKLLAYKTLLGLCVLASLLFVLLVTGLMWSMYLAIITLLQSFISCVSVYMCLVEVERNSKLQQQKQSRWHRFSCDLRLAAAFLNIVYMICSYYSEPWFSALISIRGLQCNFLSQHHSASSCLSATAGVCDFIKEGKSSHALSTAMFKVYKSNFTLACQPLHALPSSCTILVYAA